jgi:hypothetical protein
MTSQPEALRSGSGRWPRARASPSMRWPRGSDNHRQDASGDPDDSRHGSSSGRHPSQATWSWKVTDGFGGPPVSGLSPDGAVPRRAAPLPSRPWREGGSAPRSSQEHARCGRQPRQGTRPGHRGEVPGGGRRARAILRCRVDGHARVAGCVLNDLNDECLARWGPRPASSQATKGFQRGTRMRGAVSGLSPVEGVRDADGDR